MGSVSGRSAAGLSHECSVRALTDTESAPPSAQEGLGTMRVTCPPAPLLHRSWQDRGAKHRAGTSTHGALLGCTPASTQAATSAGLPGSSSGCSEPSVVLPWLQGRQHHECEGPAAVGCLYLKLSLTNVS